MDSKQTLFQEGLYTIRDFGIACGSILTFVMCADQLLQLFQIDFYKDYQLGWLGLYIVLLNALAGALCYAIIAHFIRLRKKVILLHNESTDDEKILSFELTKIVESSYSQKNYIEVIRFGKQLSRPLWVAGMYSERIKVGEIVEEAAARTNNYKTQVATLIDDIGWTNVVIGNIDTARNCISSGIALAIEMQLYYYAAKGERHLGRIFQKYQPNIVSSLEHLEKSIALAEKITDKYDKIEMQSGIYFTLSELHSTKGDFQNALTFSEKALNLYKELGNQEDRIVKIYSQLGRIHLGMRELQKAKNDFRLGIIEAEKISRRDEQGFNMLGLGEVSLSLGEKERSKEYLSSAITIFCDLGMKPEEIKARNLLFMLDGKK